VVRSFCQPNFMATIAANENLTARETLWRRAPVLVESPPITLAFTTGRRCGNFGGPPPYMFMLGASITHRLGSRDQSHRLIMAGRLLVRIDPPTAGQAGESYFFGPPRLVLGPLFKGPK